MVPGSTLMYGSSFIIVTRSPRDSRMAANEAAAMPLPGEDATAAVTKVRGVMVELPLESRSQPGGRVLCDRLTAAALARPGATAPRWPVRRADPGRISRASLPPLPARPDAAHRARR